MLRTSVPRAFKGSQLLEASHRGEGIRLQRCATNKRAINIGLAHELLDVSGLCRAAVENARGVSGCVAVVSTQCLADRTANFLCVICSSSLAGTNCPNGFVGDDNLRDLVGGEAFESRT